MPYAFDLTPTPPDWRVDWPAIRERFDWIAAMAGVQQDPTFHAEGDVETHVRMVAEAIAADVAWRALPDERRHALFVAALLHDVSKPECTVFEDGRWQSPHHARVGERRARNLLWRGEAGDVPPFAVRERVCKLVRHHGLPLRLVDKPDPERAIVSAGVEVALSDLILLARADVEGRRCASRGELHDRIDLFASTADELGVRGGPYPFAHGHHRFMYFVGRKPLGYVPHDDTWGEVTLTSGLPGGGKSTWCATHAADRPVVRMDDIRDEFDTDPSDARRKDFVLNTARERATERLRRREPFVWDATMLTREFRGSVVALAAKYGASVRVVYCEAPTYAETLRRNRSRDRRVPESVIDEMARKLEVPSLVEAHAVERVA